ncbi:MAG: alpha amylase [Ruminococcus sp.]|uniref:alpha-amylase family glycosyl hydrolase n=1 Tax=Ruminococcus sp. TaxID=41978 RepID=UPI002872DCAA|nr:alpha-amylase family glycosyl hydrolase [Ruminococcus sp.]MBQ3285307.1 alpha amylase [Ruminococcus sp.]
MKKFLSLLLAVCMIASLLAACGGSSDPVDNNKAEASTDKYRSFYQVWIGSFCDSDGNKTGDLQGLISKLDYINDGDPNAGDDLGADGIWLSPMMPSTTYHKYNVRDYYNIDPQFGTLEDFEQLIEDCHSRGIKVIIDLVLNHSGADHEFFLKACDELREGKEDGYARYYNFSKKQDSVYQHPVSGTDYYYQGDFWDQMPDWNLSFEGTRDYFDEVTKFWLDKGVDGFRLDAVKYFADKNTDAEEFLKWFCDMARGYNPDVYVVGEDWDDAGNVYDMYESGVDSLFNFKFANSGGEFMLASHTMTSDALKKLKKYDDNIKKRNENAINANFLTNHDMTRVANILDEDDNKMAAALYMLAPGNSFTYNGEEIGMEADGNEDPYKRTAMIWDNENLPDITVEGIKAQENELGGVEQQLKDDHSLLNTYRKLFKLRLQNPEIARGDIEEVLDLGDPNVGGMIINHDGSRVLVIHNTTEEAKELTVDMIENPELRGWVYGDLTEEPNKETPKLNGTTLTLPVRTSVVIKENK